MFRPAGPVHVAKVVENNQVVFTNRSQEESQDLLLTRTRMGTNDILNDGPCLAMAYLGIAQSYAGKCLAPNQVVSLLSDNKIWNGSEAGAGKYAIGKGLDILMGEGASDLLTIIVSRPGDADYEQTKEKAMYGLLHVKRNDNGTYGHWQEGDNTGKFVWDPLDGIEGGNRQKNDDDTRWVVIEQKGRLD
jgi:hypothetical protein